ncbi:MAG: folylpolyglutamate synthase/dihydrofolate synthase family protein [Bacteroidota bacterium]|nr:folylpolyglutamate synthase/dihydrofolate synthase family protein [Bacteroidota bacterium]MDP4226061.1 folylpolyglutamate synthase/dihydrofolate synthase family protein [Bacteroidota bacterium]MDP4274269.1 folylpolyglutamate synthase/dihydrofolate synthase family protein [Bacteroidota bacterium]
MTYQETLDYLFSQLPMFTRVGKPAYKNDLTDSLKLDEHFGHPHQKFKTIHVAGTNGKGSVSHLIASILQSAGYKVGLYTSPHLKDFRERIKINGEMIPQQEVISFVEGNKAYFEEIKPSFFEMTVALAFKYFASQNVDVAVIEVGLGGRLDSTNIITPVLSVITNIGLDHTDILGGTLEKIAAEKAGIIKKKVPVVIGETNQRTYRVFTDKAKEEEAPVYFADEEYEVDYSFITMDHLQSFDIAVDGNVVYENLQTDLLGLYQRKNILTVIKAVDILKQLNFHISDRDLYEGVAEVSAKTGLQGRWQVIHRNPLTICDTGHNEDGIRFVSEQFNSIPFKKLHIVFGVVKDKKIDEMLKLMPKNATYYFTRAGIPRALDENILLERGKLYGLRGEAYHSVKEAFEAARMAAEPADMIFIGGSTYIVAEIF